MLRGDVCFFHGVALPISFHSGGWCWLHTSM